MIPQPLGLIAICAPAAAALAVLLVAFAAGWAYPDKDARAHGLPIQLSPIAACVGLQPSALAAGGWAAMPAEAVGAAQASNGAYAGLLAAQSLRALRGNDVWALLPGLPALGLLASALALANAARCSPPRSFRRVRRNHRTPRPGWARTSSS
jgi:hypothetical protein